MPNFKSFGPTEKGKQNLDLHCIVSAVTTMQSCLLIIWLIYSDTSVQAYENMNQLQLQHTFAGKTLRCFYTYRSTKSLPC